MRTRERDCEKKREKKREGERRTRGGGREGNRASSYEYWTYFRIGKMYKRNDRPVMHRGIRCKSSDRTRRGPIPVVATHARIISAARSGAYLLPRTVRIGTNAAMPYRPHVRPKVHYNDSRGEIVFRCRNRSPISRISRSLNSQHLTQIIPFCYTKLEVIFLNKNRRIFLQ